MRQNFPTRRTFLCSATAAWPALSVLRAQEQHAQTAGKDNDATFSSDVKVVNLLATVRDKQGRIVSTLTKDDFTVSEDGRAQTIKYFSRETDLPLTLGLLVDTSLSQRRVLGQEKTASYRFVDKVLRAEKDKTFVIHFDHESELLQDLTSSRAELQRALDELELPADGRQQSSRGTGPGGGGNSGGGNSGGGGMGGGIGYPGGGIGFPGGRGGGGRRGGGQQRGGGGRGRSGGAGTTMYDAIYLAADEIMKKQQGRKAIILLTDGVDQGSKTFLSDAIEAAQRADTLAYSILFSDETAYGSGGLLGGNRGGGGDHPDGKKILQRISKETGGSFFEVSKKLSIDDIFDRIQEELRNQYSIGYSPDRTEASSGYRAVKVTARDSKMVVQTREGYYPGVR